MYRFRIFLKYLKLIDKLVYLYGKTIKLAIPRSYKRIAHFRNFTDNVQSLGYYIQLQSNHLVLQSTFGSLTLRRNTSDIDVFKQVFINNEYQIVIDYFIINQIQVDTIIDAGANIGLTSLKFATSFPNSKIICIEPDSDNYKQLQLNLKGLNNVFSLKKALWYESDFLTFERVFRDSREWSIQVTKSHNKEDALVPALSIHDLIKDYDLQEVDFLKIDIEGSEAEIFKEEHDLSYLNIVKIIAVEIHDELDCRLEIYKILKNYGFLIFNSGELTIGIKPS